MLVERIKVDKVLTSRMGGKDCLKQEETPDADDENSTATKKKKLKLFCETMVSEIIFVSQYFKCEVSLYLPPELYPV